jgi:hypothetical protein
MASTPVPTLNFTGNTPSRPVISLPDTPSSRLLIENWNRQAARRQSTQQVLFSGTPSSYLTPSRIPARDHTDFNDLSAGPNQSQSQQIPARGRTNVNLFNTNANDPEIIISDSMSADPETSELPALGRLITSKIISGCSNSTHVSSLQAFDICLSSTNIRSQFPEIYESKKNRCATTPALFSSILEHEKHLKFPDTEAGEHLREVMKSLTSAISSEYCTAARIDAELILCALKNMNLAASKCFLNQFHRGISCSEQEFEIFEDECASGKISHININYSLPIELTAGFLLISTQSDSNVFLIRLATALTDYMAYSSNSDLQKHYTNARDRWLSVRLTPEMKADSFAITEEETFSCFRAAAAAAHRSVPDQLDRGLAILKHLPLNVKTFIDKQSKKKSVPENMMHRDWVFTQVRRIEQENKSKYSWATSEAGICLKYLNGTCSYGTKCKYTHDGTVTVITPPQPTVSLATAHDPETLAPDNVVIQCALQSSGCLKTFNMSPAHWATLKTPEGQPFSQPKYCKPCRIVKKQMALDRQKTQPVSMVTAFDEYTDHHENDGADDDYLIDMQGWTMSMAASL